MKNISPFRGSFIVRFFKDKIRVQKDTERKAKRLRDEIAEDIHEIKNWLKTGPTLACELPTGKVQLSALLGKMGIADLALLESKFPEINEHLKKALSTQNTETPETHTGSEKETLGQLVNNYCLSWMRENGKAKMYNSELYGFWIERSHLRNRPWDKIEKGDLLDARTQYEEEPTRSNKKRENITVNKCMNRLKTVYMDARDVHGYPLTWVFPKRRVQKEMHTYPFTLQERQTIVAASYELGGMYGPIVELHALTAIRAESMASLEWDHVIFKRKVIVRPMKGDDGIKMRTVVLSKRALKILKDLYKHRTNEVWVFPADNASRPYPYKHDWMETWQDKLTLKGAFPESDSPNLVVRRLHSFRAGIATDMIRAGISDLEVCKVLTCTKENLKNYVNIKEEEMVAMARESLEKVIG